MIGPNSVGGGVVAEIFPVAAIEHHSNCLNSGTFFDIYGTPADHPPFLFFNNINSLQKKNIYQKLGGGHGPRGPLATPLALSPLLFITVMDVISQEVGRGPPLVLLFADDLVLCENTREEAEEQLELWRNAIENKGLRVIGNKTEYLPPSSCHDKVKLGSE